MTKHKPTCKHPLLKKECHVWTSFSAGLTDFLGFVALADVVHQHSHEIAQMGLLGGLAGLCLVTRFIVEL